MRKYSLPGYRDFKTHTDDLLEMGAAAEQERNSPEFIIESAILEKDIHALVVRLDALAARQEHDEIREEDKKEFELLRTEIADLKRLQEPLRQFEEIPQNVLDHIDYLTSLEKRLKKDILSDPDNAT